MSMSQETGVAPAGRHDELPRTARPDPLSLKQLGPPVRRAVVRTRGWLMEHQHPEGFWCAELEGDTILESETILLLAHLGREDSELAHRWAAYLVEKQLPEGGWSLYPGGGVDISASVKAYFALKLIGHDPGAEYMQRARDAILGHGGADAVNSYTRFHLALLGQIPYEQCPAVPPEMVLLPKWFPVNLYAVSAWSRTILVPLSVVWATRPVRKVEARYGIRELFLKDPANWPPLHLPGCSGSSGPLSWDCFFRTIDRMLKWSEYRGLLPLRRRALAAAEKWMLARFKGSDGLGAIYPPIVWSILALKCLGYADDSPEVQGCHRQLDNLVIHDEASQTARLQPCKSPVWDTAIALRALADSGVRPDCPAVRRAVDWLLAKQITRRGDWAETVDTEPGGWCFEHANDCYPDLDDTAMALMALRGQFADPPQPVEALPPELRLLSEGAAGDDDAEKLAAMERTTAAIDRGLRWMLAMQNRDGGWGAFDRNNNRKFLCHVPFADHNAMIDPSTPDVTGRVLESLGRLGYRVGDTAVDRAVDYLRGSQQPDGSWIGRWGVNYIYGTWRALSGMAEVGVPTDNPAVAAGAHWLLNYQQPCGGWGESPDSYQKPHLRGQGPPTASQTAWALMGLLSAGYQEHPAVARGVRYLIETQNDDGTWEEREFTGTGFPLVFYLRYHYYPIYFPLMALAQWAVKVASLPGGDPPSLQLAGGVS
jgi:squalene-hopene/tetraprenyl-beta-curcumene cyclase